MTRLKPGDWADNRRWMRTDNSERGPWWLSDAELISECASGVPRILIDRDGHVVGDPR